MPLWTPSSRMLSSGNNFGAVNVTMGTSVTPGASNVEGTYTQLFSGASITQDIAGFYLRVTDGAAGALTKSHLLDIGIDQAGGTSYTAIISNIVCGASGTTATVGGGHKFFFPMRIPSGCSIGARIQGSAATPGTVRVSMKYYTGRQQSAPWMLPIGGYSETLGTITGSTGVSFTPGTSANGTWVSLGTTVRDLWWWQLCYQIDNNNMAAKYCLIDLGYGTPGNQMVLLSRFCGSTTNEQIGDPLDTHLIWYESYCPVAAGTEMWVRGNSDVAPDTGWAAVAVGIGG